jgi:flavin-binding protein dodecin
MATVLMHFGDGSFKTLEMSADNPQEAVEEAKTWVSDNAWFEVQGDQGEVLAEEHLS